MLGLLRFTFNAFGENTYVVYDAATLAAAIVDPGCSDEREWAALRDEVRRLGLKVEYILLTHSHMDHVLGTGYCTAEYGIGASGSLADQLALPAPQEQAFLFGIECDTRPASIVNDLAHGATFAIGGLRTEVIDVPGHSPHGLCYYMPDERVVFSGDVLFAGSIGRTDFGPRFGCDGRALVEGITTRLLTLPPDVAVFPGHGPQTTIGQEATSNPYL